MQGEKPTFDPFATVQIVATRDDSVSAVCFADIKLEIEQPDEISSSSSSDDEDELVLPSRHLLSNHVNTTSAVYITGQRSGDTFLWKGHSRLRELTPNRGGTCLTLQRAGASRVLLQTKDEAGTVSFHDLETHATISKIETRSRTFCAAVAYSSQLTVLPTSVESVVQLYDARQSAAAKTMVFHAAGLSPTDDIHLRKYGMTSSLAVDASANMVACGMESGHVFNHDIRMEPRVCSSVHLESSDPVICLDMMKGTEDSVVTVAGQAGDKEDQNTISWVESKRKDYSTVESRVRTQLSTSRTGKTGISSARLLSERLVAVGGWDGRLRVFNRSKLMALGRGHTGSIQSLDWHDSYVITGGVDGRVLLWDVRPFSAVKNNKV